MKERPPVRQQQMEVRDTVVEDAAKLCIVSMSEDIVGSCE